MSYSDIIPNMEESLILPPYCARVALGMDIETAGEHPIHHAMYGLGCVALALVADNLLSDTWKIVEVARLRLSGWVPGTQRYSIRCMSEFLSKTNEPDFKQEERREVAAQNNWIGAEEFPRIAPLVYRGPLDESSREREMYSLWIQFRKWVFDACAEKNVPVKQCTDNGLFDMGWFLCLSSHYKMLPPNYQDVRANGEFGKYTSTVETDCALEGVAYTVLNTYDDLMGTPSIFDDFYDKNPMTMIRRLYNVPDMSVITAHMPDDDAAKIAHEYLIYFGCTRGHFPLSEDVFSLIDIHDPLDLPLSPPPLDDDADTTNYVRSCHKIGKSLVGLSCISVIAAVVATAVFSLYLILFPYVLIQSSGYQTRLT